MTSFCMHYEKSQRGLLLEAFCGEGEGFKDSTKKTCLLLMPCMHSSKALHPGPIEGTALCDCEYTQTKWCIFLLAISTRWDLNLVYPDLGLMK